MVAVISFCVFCSFAEAKPKKDAKAEFTLKLATFTPAKSFWTTNYLDPFMERVVNLTDGRVQFQYYPAEQIGKAADSLETVSYGVADISLFVPNYTPSEMPLSAKLIAMPGMFETSMQGLIAYSEVARKSPMLETDYLKNGVRPLSLSMTPVYEFFTSGKEIRVPDDIKGVKVRAQGGVISEALNFFEAIPVPMSSSEVYTAYSRGIVDALHYSYAAVEKFGLVELTKVSTNGVRFGASVVGLIINEDLYQNLPEDIQKALMQAGEEMAKTFNEYFVNEQNKIVKDWKASGKVKVLELTEDEKKQWQDLYNKFHKVFIEKQDNKKFNTTLKLFLEEINKK